MCTERLRNGLTLIYKPHNQEKNRVHVQLLVRAGSLMEREEERGVAHLLEHLVFRRTQEFKDMEIWGILGALGVAIGACANAETTYDYTKYFMRVPLPEGQGEVILDAVRDKLRAE